MTTIQTNITLSLNPAPNSILRSFWRAIYLGSWLCYCMYSLMSFILFTSLAMYILLIGDRKVALKCIGGQDNMWLCFNWKIIGSGPWNWPPWLTLPDIGEWRGGTILHGNSLNSAKINRTISQIFATILPSRTGLWTSPLMISRFDEYERRDIRADHKDTHQCSDSTLTPHGDILAGTSSLLTPLYIWSASKLSQQIKPAHRCRMLHSVVGPHDGHKDDLPSFGIRKAGLIGPVQWTSLFFVGWGIVAGFRISMVVSLKCFLVMYLVNILEKCAISFYEIRPCLNSFF